MATVSRRRPASPIRDDRPQIALTREPAAIAHEPSSPVRHGVVAVAVVAVPAIVLGTLTSLTAGLAVLAFGACVQWWRHARRLRAFGAWVRSPQTPAPPAERDDIWGDVGSDLARRFREASETRDALRAQLDRFREAGQAMPDGVVYLSEDGRIDWVNRAAERHFGIDRARDDGKALTSLLRDPEFVHYFAAGKFAEPLVMRSQRRTRRVLLIQVVTFGDARRMIVSRDISQLEKLETMRRDFIANVSHELRTPLTVVGGFVETVLDAMDELEPAEIRHYLGLAYDQSQRMRNLIEDLLTLSALETGAPAPAEEPIEVVSMLREIADDARALSAGRHRITLDVAGECANDVLFGSHKELRSAFGNLASNAVRYTPEGGAIRLRWSRHGGGAEFSVEDDGIGIEPQHIPRLTERFYRVDRGRSREVGGTGLGLAIVKHVASRHQAELFIESEPGKGSRFSVRLPASRLAPAHPAARS